MKNARKFSWSEYFGNKGKVTQTKNGNPFSDTSGSRNYYVFACFFKECKNNGAIYIHRYNEACALLEENTFSRCQSNERGGSVYFLDQELGEFVQQRNSYSESKAEHEITFS